MFPRDSRFPAPIEHLAKRRSGFALLVTITLVAFLVLILVALATFTRVETTVATNNQQLTQARQNALFALNVALGELQKYAGPDQRVTARADFDQAIANSATANKFWTGVYGSRVAANYSEGPNEIADAITDAYTAAGADALASRGSQAILLNWLVSGNENTPWDMRAGADVNADGSIRRTAPHPISNNPANPVDFALVSPAPPASGTGSTSVLVVGPASVTTTSEHVSAPLVSLTVASDTLAGFAGTPGEQTIGRYAWWVGDEGLKARLNLPKRDDLPAAQAFGTSQRNAVELMTSVGSAYDPTSPALTRVLELNQLPMLNPTASASLDQARKAYFHDLTTHSTSLLTDTYAGGLKKDLSALLSTTASQPADTAYLFVPSSDALNFVPTWGQLRSYVRQRTRPLGSVGSQLPIKLPTDTDSGIYPVMSFVEVALEYYLQGTDINIAVMPRIVLWNPYTRPLERARYEFGVALTNNGWFQLQTRPLGSTSESDWTAKEPPRRITLMGKTVGSPGPANTYFRFIVDCDEIAPGESLVYTLGSTGTYDADYGTAPQNVLTENRFISPHYAIIATGQTIDPATEELRVIGVDVGGVTGQFFQGNPIAYLGLDPANPGYLETNPNPGTWPSATRRWYQTMATGVGGGAEGGPFPILQSQFQSIPGLSSPWGVTVRYSFPSKYLAMVNPRGQMGTLVFQGFRGVDRRQGTTISDAFNPSSDDRRASSAVGLDAKADGSPMENILFEFLPEGQPLLSIGQLQHANLSSHMHLPAYAIGNSLALSTHLNPDTTNRNRLYRFRETGTGGSATATARHVGGLYDVSYLLNRSLMDRYFVSTVPHAGTAGGSDLGIPAILPNPRHIRTGNSTEQGLRDANLAAANLLLAGGFNVNSTSEQAWRAVLGALNQLSYAPDGTNDGPTDAALSRFIDPPDAINPVSGDPSWAFKGYRRLSAQQIAELSRQIVREVRSRGPFVSLADFVNRRLKDNPATVAANGAPNANESVQGAIQNAIENTPTTGAGSINNSRGIAPFTTGFNITPGGQLDLLVARGGPTANSNTANAPHGSGLTYSAQYLSQADVLSRIGANLVARSDTFVVRTYGDVKNPATDEIVARAWCEAVVQRVIDPVNRKSTDASSPDYYEPATATAAAPDFGRRFQIISFRWLSASDI